jgi:Ca2+-binding RTX toxin-like protein
LRAVGGTSDISSNVDQDALLAVGNIVLNAGRDVNFGTVGVDFDNDVRAGGGIFINAGRHFHIDGFSDMAADDQGLQTNGGVTIIAGGDILIDDANGTDASVGVSGGGSTGAVVLQTGLGRSLVLHASSTSALFAGAGGVTIRADQILIEADSGISVTGGGTATLTTASAGHAINVGSATDGALALELSDAELDRIFAQNVVIGSDTAGTLSVNGAITHPNSNLTLRTGGDLFIDANISTTTKLSLLAADEIIQAVGTTITTASVVASVDAPDFDPAGGVVTFNGSVAAASLVVNGGPDNDTLNGTANANSLFGFDGNDTLRGFGDNDTLDGGAGNDVLDGGIGNDIMTGGAGDDVFFVDSASDVVVEGAGGGFDLVFTSINYALGGEAERLSTADPASTAPLSLTGNAKPNEITGNAGANIIDGGAGADLMVGGGGDDIYFVDNAGDVVSDAPGGGFDTVFSSISFVLTTLIERVVAADVSAVTALNFTGNASVNEITGNNGGNMIDGGGGADLLIGNGGADAFAFTTALGGGNVDALPDFQVGIDRLYIDDAVFTGLTPGALPASAFRVGAAAADADDRIIYNSATGALLFDADGNGAGLAVQWATLHEALPLTAADFQVI